MRGRLITFVSALQVRLFCIRGILCPFLLHYLRDMPVTVPRDSEGYVPLGTVIREVPAII
jgi:hypothetical protein